MAVAARWIHLHLPHLEAMPAVCAAFARVQAPGSMPAVLWGSGEELRHALAIVAPLKHLPGRSTRWRSWALAPLVATYRRCGLSAYFDSDRICLSGQPISGIEATTIGACAVIITEFTAWGVDFMDALRARIEAQHSWQFDNSWPGAIERDAIAEALLGVVADAR